METRQLDAFTPSPVAPAAAPARRPGRLRARPYGRAASGAVAAGTRAAGPPVARMAAAGTAAASTRLARSLRLAPPLTAPAASCAPSHATSGGS